MLGFLSEIVQKVDAGPLQDRLKLAIEAELAGVSLTAMTAIRICAQDELGQDEALRVDVDDLSIAIVKDSERNRSRDRRHLHARRHLAV